MDTYCKKCNKNFHTTSRLKIHNNRKYKCDNDFSCHRCNKKFKNMFLLNRHINKKYICKKNIFDKKYYENLNTFEDSYKIMYDEKINDEIKNIKDEYEKQIKAYETTIQELTDKKFTNNTNNNVDEKLINDVYIVLQINKDFKYIKEEQINTYLETLEKKLKNNEDIRYDFFYLLIATSVKYYKRIKKYFDITVINKYIFDKDTRIKIVDLMIDLQQALIYIGKNSIKYYIGKKDIKTISSEISRINPNHHKELLLKYGNILI